MKSNTEIVLLVGGPRDGDRIEIEDGLTHIRFAIPYVFSPIEHDDIAPENIPINIATYRREWLGDQFGRYPIFVHGEPDQSWISKLIAGYSK